MVLDVQSCSAELTNELVGQPEVVLIKAVAKESAARRITCYMCMFLLSFGKIWVVHNLFLLLFFFKKNYVPTILTYPYSQYDGKG